MSNSKCKKGWALESSHATRTLDTKAKEIAAEYFYSQRSLDPPRRADPAAMRKRLIDAKDPSDPTGSRNLLEYAAIPSEKQLQPLFSRLESSRLKGPKKSTATVPKTTNDAPSRSARVTRSQTSVRATIGETRKRTVVKESEEHSDESGVSDEMEDEVFENGEVENGEVEKGAEEEEMLRMQEEDFIRKVISEEKDNIFK